MKSKILLSFSLLFLIALNIKAQCSFSVSTTVTNIACYNGTTGVITANVTGGTTPYQYQLAEAGAGAWQPGNSFTALTAGTYPLSVKDATGCIKTVYATVTQPTQLAVGYSSIDPTCTGSSNGSITVSPSGGVTPYTYNWTKNGSAFATTQNISNLSVGNYILILTDANGCATSPIINSVMKPIGMTGYNEDVVANGSSVAANAASTQPMDQGPGNIFYAAGYTNSAGSSGTGGLPASGSFTSAQTSTRSYQLASYSASNAMVLRSSSDASYGGAVSGTFSFLSQYKNPYSTLYLVGTTGSGTGTANYTVNFSDGSTYTGSLNFPDWYLTAATASTSRALGSLDRITRESPGSYTGATNFNLFEAPITVPIGSQGKNINSVDFAWSAANTARINLFAITAYTSTTVGIRINDGASSGTTPAVSISSNTSSNQFCNGQSVIFTATPTNGGNSPTYQWKKNGTNISGATGVTYTTSGLANNDVISVVLTASGGTSCLTTSTATSNTLTMTLGTKAAAVSAATASTSVCSGNTIAFTAVPVNEGASPTYQWKVNGTNAGTNSPNFSSSTLNNNDQVTVTMTSSISCATNKPVTSSAVVMTVNANATPTVSITTANPKLTFNTTITNGGSSPAYQCYKNGAAIPGATSPSYYNAAAAVGEQYSAKLTSNYSCQTAPAAMSNYVMVTAALLPVKWESFDATVKAEKVLLNWKTAAEWQSKDFIVQRSTAPAAGFENIGKLPASNQPNGSAYNFTDIPPASNTYYYRLLQQDIDGVQTFSKIISVAIQSNKSWMVTDNGSSWLVQSNRILNYNLLNAQGKLLERGTVNGTGYIAKPAQNGVYFLNTIYNGVSAVKKVMK